MTVLTRIMMIIALLVASSFGALAQDGKFVIENIDDLEVAEPLPQEANSNRFALLIFNNAYENGLPELPVAEEDAKAVLKALLGMGYGFDNILVLQNQPKLDLEDATIEFSSKMDTKSELLIFYSGHSVGMKESQENYLLPADFETPQSRDARLSERRIKQRSITLETLVRDFKQSGVDNIYVVYDGCRARALPKDVEAPYNEFLLETGCYNPKIDGAAVFYSGAPGQETRDSIKPDDPTKVSAFGRVLVSTLVRNPNINVSALDKELSWSVSQFARRANSEESEQTPVFVNGLSIPDEKLTEKCFGMRLINGTPSCADLEGKVEEEAPKETASSPTVLNGVNAAEDWDTAKAGDNCALYTAFKNKHPSSIYAIKAGQLIRAKCSDGTASAAKPAAAVIGAPKPQEQPSIGTSGSGTGIVRINPNCVPTVNSSQPALLNRQGFAQLQKELNRLGCDVGNPDGIWGNGSKRGMRAFLKETNISVSVDQPNCDFLDQIKAFPNQRVCPVVCGVRFNKVGDQCVLKTCKAGQKLSSKGNCYTPKVTCKSGQKLSSKGNCYWPKKTATPSTPKPETTPKPQPAPATQQNCFVWKGETICD